MFARCKREVNLSGLAELLSSCSWLKIKALTTITFVFLLWFLDHLLCSLFVDKNPQLLPQNLRYTRTKFSSEDQNTLLSNSMSQKKKTPRITKYLGSTFSTHLSQGSSRLQDKGESALRKIARKLQGSCSLPFVRKFR